MSCPFFSVMRTISKPATPKSAAPELATPKLECRSLWKIFGDASTKICQENRPKNQPENHSSDADLTKAALEQGCIIGARDVNFSVNPGELFVIMGLSGSGKSTVLRSIAQLHRPSLGQVFLDGEDLAAMSEKDLTEIRRRKMGMVFQNFGLVPHFTAIDNIAFPLKMRGETAAIRHQKAEEMLKLVGLEGRGQAYPHELSGGQQQRVGIARSLAVDPEVWLLDEPFSALDPLIRRQLQDELLALQSTLKKSIVFITHDFAEAVKLADRIAIMRDGQIIQQGSAADLLLHPADHYVRAFVEDVPRLQVLTLADIMTQKKPGKPKTKTLSLDQSTSLETAMLAMASGEKNIIVTEQGKAIGHVSHDDIFNAVRMVE